jgi:hypothetical protein
MSFQAFVATALLALPIGPVQAVWPAGQEGQRPPTQPRPGVRMPARDLPEAPAGTARISGRVLAADNGMPVRRAQVRVSSSELPGGRLAISDADGRYSFAELPAGRYTLHVIKAGFVSIQYGQIRPFEPGRPVDLADRQHLERVDFVLPRGGVITGRVLDEFGDPVAEATVQVLRYQYMSGERQLTPAGRGDQTNDLGQFRIFGLSPGDYIVSATVRSEMMGMGAISAEAGARMTVMTGMLVPGSDDAERTGYAPTYFPGTTSPAEAQRVRVAVAQETSGIEFSLIETQLSRISGIALRADGRPMTAGFVTLVPGDRGRMMMAGGRSGQIQGDGSFTIAGVPPGEYVLQARAMPEMEGGGRGQMVMRFGPDGPEMEMALLPLTVTGADVSGLTLMATRGADVNGRVVFEGALPSPAELERVRVNAGPGTPAGGMMFMGPGGAASVKEDGTFELRNLIGPRLIRVAAPAGWILKAVYYGGRDIVDTPFEFLEGDDGGTLDVVLTNRAAEVSGTVGDGRGGLAEDSTVLLFADDPDRWGFQSRFVRTARPDQAGRYTVPALPAATYVAVALGYVERGQWNDPEFLEQVRPLGTRVTLGEGESRVLDLQLTPSGSP